MKKVLSFIKNIISFLYGLAFGAFGIVCLVVGFLGGAETFKPKPRFRPEYRPYYSYNKPTSYSDYYRKREEEEDADV